MGVLNQSAIPSTWGVVGGCYAHGLAELRDIVPQAYDAVATPLETLAEVPIVLFGHAVLSRRGSGDRAFPA